MLVIKSLTAKPISPNVCVNIDQRTKRISRRLLSEPITYIIMLLNRVTSCHVLPDLLVSLALYGVVAIVGFILDEIRIFTLDCAQNNFIPD